MPRRRRTLTPKQMHEQAREHEARERAEKMKATVDQIVRLSPARGELHGWAIQLAEMFNMSVQCDRCDGLGTHDKHRNCNHYGEDRWIRECGKQVECRKCFGVGTVFLNTENRP